MSFSQISSDDRALSLGGLLLISLSEGAAEGPSEAGYLAATHTPLSLPDSRWLPANQPFESTGAPGRSARLQGRAVI
ncbi:hypothetical protein MHYP_G00082420 [Metynnis hypsauchen]